MRVQPSRRISRIVLAVAVCLVLVSTASAAETFDRMVIFGDSLSDPGNHFVAFGITSQPPYAPLPDFPYGIGGHHFSNGPTWAERLTRALGMPTSGKPALRAPGIFTNYAVGRARARANAPAFPQFDLGTQVQRFLADVSGHAPSSALYVIWIGANDFDDALVAMQTNPAEAPVILDAAVRAIAGNVYTLWAAGARNFMILNLPDPTFAPVVRALPAQLQAIVRQAGAMYNEAIHGALAQLSALPGLRLDPFDVNAVFGEIVATHGDDELSNVTEPCLSFGVTVHAVCKHPSRYLFWDAAHPTTAGHRLIAEAALRLFERASETDADDVRNARR
jgi:phospholipase/lecithinase/hemolysin